MSPCNASACSRKRKLGFVRLSLLRKSSSLLSLVFKKRETNIARVEMHQRMPSEPLLQQECGGNPPPEVSRAGVLDLVVHWELPLLFTGA